MSMNLQRAVSAIEETGHFTLIETHGDQDFFARLLASRPCVCVFSVHNSESGQGICWVLQKLRDYRLEQGGPPKDPTLRIVLLIDDRDLPIERWQPAGVHEFLFAPIAPKALAYKLSKHHEKAFMEPVPQVQRPPEWVRIEGVPPPSNEVWMVRKPKPSGNSPQTEYCFPENFKARAVQSEPEKKIVIMISTRELQPDQGEWRARADTPMAQAKSWEWCGNAKAALEASPTQFQFVGECPVYDKKKGAWVLVSSDPQLTRTRNDGGPQEKLISTDWGEQGPQITTFPVAEIEVQAVGFQEYAAGTRLPEKPEVGFVPAPEEPSEASSSRETRFPPHTAHSSRPAEKTEVNLRMERGSSSSHSEENESQSRLNSNKASVDPDAMVVSGSSRNSRAADGHLSHPQPTKPGPSASEPEASPRSGSGNSPEGFSKVRISGELDPGSADLSKLSRGTAPDDSNSSEIRVSKESEARGGFGSSERSQSDTGSEAALNQKSGAKESASSNWGKGSGAAQSRENSGAMGPSAGDRQQGDSPTQMFGKKMEGAPDLRASGGTSHEAGDASARFGADAKAAADAQKFAAEKQRATTDTHISGEPQDGSGDQVVSGGDTEGNAFGIQGMDENIRTQRERKSKSGEKEGESQNQSKESLAERLKKISDLAASADNPKPVAPVVNVAAGPSATQKKSPPREQKPQSWFSRILKIFGAG